MIAVAERQGSKMPSVILLAVESKELTEGFTVRSFLYYDYGYMGRNRLVREAME